MRVEQRIHQLVAPDRVCKFRKASPAETFRRVRMQRIADLIAAAQDACHAVRHTFSVRQVRRPLSRTDRRNFAALSPLHAQPSRACRTGSASTASLPSSKSRSRAAFGRVESSASASNAANVGLPNWEVEQRENGPTSAHPARSQIAVFFTFLRSSHPAAFEVVQFVRFSGSSRILLLAGVFGVSVMGCSIAHRSRPPFHVLHLRSTLQLR